MVRHGRPENGLVVKRCNFSRLILADLSQRLDVNRSGGSLGKISNDQSRLFHSITQHNTDKPTRPTNSRRTFTGISLVSCIPYLHAIGNRWCCSWWRMFNTAMGKKRTCSTPTQTMLWTVWSCPTALGSIDGSLWQSTCLNRKMHRRFWYP